MRTSRGARDYSAPLWTLLMFEAFLRNVVDAGRRTAPRELASRHERMRILHVLDHSLPLHSGYAFRTLAILREQRGARLGDVSADHAAAGRVRGRRRDVDGWRFHRTPLPRRAGWQRVPASPSLREMAATARAHRRADRPLAARHRCTRIRRCSTRCRPVGRPPARHPVVYELRALWEDAAVDHGTTREGSLRYRVIARAGDASRCAAPITITTICEACATTSSARGIARERDHGDPQRRRHATLLVRRRAPDAALRTRSASTARRCSASPARSTPTKGSTCCSTRCALLAPRIPNCACCWSAAARRKPRCASAAAALGRRRRVVFTGRVPHADVQRYYDLIDVLAYPRRSMRLTELVTPLKPLEAMAQGRMFVASDVGGHRELIRDGETGFCFRPATSPRWRRRSTRVLGARDAWPAMRAARARVRRERAHLGAQRRALRDVYRRLRRRGDGRAPRDSRARGA